jgi:hypothetical protein
MAGAAFSSCQQIMLSKNNDKVGQSVHHDSLLVFHWETGGSS